MTINNNRLSNVLLSDITCGVLNIPYGVTKICSHSVSNLDFQILVIPNSVKIIESCAFAGCTQIQELFCPNSVEAIESRAFCDCSGLTKVRLPQELHSIGRDVFEGCPKISSVDGPSFLEKIKDNVFDPAAPIQFKRHIQTKALDIYEYWVSDNLVFRGAALNFNDADYCFRDKMGYFPRIEDFQLIRR